MSANSVSDEGSKVYYTLEKIHRKDRGQFVLLSESADPISRRAIFFGNPEGLICGWREYNVACSRKTGGYIRC